MGMNSSSSMSDPLGWMGPSDAKNAGKTLCYEIEAALLDSNTPKARSGPRQHWNANLLVAMMLMSNLI